MKGDGVSSLVKPARKIAERLTSSFCMHAMRGLCGHKFLSATLRTLAHPLHHLPPRTRSTPQPLNETIRQLDN